MAKIKWNGDTSKNSPYFNLRQAGLSHNEVVARLGVDAMDLEAEREGSAIRSASEVRVKKSSKKPKIGSVNSETLDNSFYKHYGYSGYVAKKEEN